MWNQIADFAKQLFMQSQETQKNKGDIKELQKEVKELSATVQRLIYEVHRMGENEQHEREKMALRFELELLRSGRQLPATLPDKDPRESRDCSQPLTAAVAATGKTNQESPRLTARAFSLSF